MLPFHITIGRDRDAPRLSFPVMAENADRAHAQAMDLAESAEERVEVTPAQRMRAELQQLANEIVARVDFTKPAWPVNGTPEEISRANDTPYLTPRQKRQAQRNDSGYGYGRWCCRCGGTDSGDSPRGWVGKCTCGGLA